MPEPSRARQRALARQARRDGPRPPSRHTLAAAALSVFAVGALLGGGIGLLVGGDRDDPGPRPAEVAKPAQQKPAAPSPAQPSTAEPAREASRHGGRDESHAPPSPEPTTTLPHPEPAAAGAGEAADAAGERAAPVDLTQVLDVTDRIVAQARPRAPAEAAGARAVAPPAWRRNAAAYAEPAAGTPRIAVVIDDLGLNRPNAWDTLELPGPLTLAFMTYAPGVGELTEAARANGHELLVHVPMQPTDTATDPGPKVLTSEVDRAELLRRLDWGLSRFDGFVGINNHMGSAFTRDAAGMRTVLGELKRRGLLFLDSRTIAGSVAAELAGELDVAHASRDVFLDNQRAVPAIRAQLAEAERIARRTGSAIAIGHPHDATIRALQAWLPTLRDKGIALVPVSALAKGDRGPDVAQLPASWE